MNKDTEKLIDLASLQLMIQAVKESYRNNYPIENLVSHRNELIKSIVFDNVEFEYVNHLGFRMWDKSSTSEVVPLWLFNILPDDTELECILSGITRKSNADNDIRGGCVAYMIQLKK